MMLKKGGNSKVKEFCHLLSFWDCKLLEKECLFHVKGRPKMTSRNFEPHPPTVTLFRNKALLLSSQNLLAPNSYGPMALTSFTDNPFCGHDFYEIMVSQKFFH